MRLIACIVLLAGLGAIWWWLDGWFDLHALVRSSGAEYTLAAEGWGVVWHLWPLSMLGVLIGGGATFFVLMYAYQYLTEAEHQQVLAKRTSLCEQREQAASDRVQQAQHRVASATQTAERQVAELQQEARRQMAQAQAAQRAVQAQQQALAQQGAQLQQAQGELERERAELLLKAARVTGAHRRFENKKKKQQTQTVA